MVLDLNTQKDLQIFLAHKTIFDYKEMEDPNRHSERIEESVFDFEQNGFESKVQILTGKELVLIVDNLFQILNLKELKIVLNVGSKLTIVERNDSEVNENLVVEQAENSIFLYQKLYSSDGKSILTVFQLGDNCVSNIQNIVLGSYINLEIDQKVIQSGNEQKVEHRTKFILDNNSDLKVSHFGHSCIESADCIIGQKIKGVILDSDSKVEMQPILEIDSDSSTSSHGASVGEFDDNEIFYLHSRGLNPTQTQQILVDSFLNDLFDNIEPICVRERWKG